MALRPTLPPQIYTHGDVQLCYPQDTEGGGSWIATNNQGRICCLLNGGLIAHKKQAKHTHSRGQVLLKLASSHKDAHTLLTNEDLSKVQPFTILCIDRRGAAIVYFSEFIWDGKNKHYKTLDSEKPQIWSSVTLYSKAQQDDRDRWFSAFLEQYKGHITQQDIYAFHTGTHTNDSTNNVIMERENDLKTVSVTQVTQANGKSQMSYMDLIVDKAYKLSI